MTSLFSGAMPILMATTLTLLAPAARAEVDCPDFGLGDASLQERFCEELNTLLAAPYDGGTSDRSNGAPRDALMQLIEQDAVLFEAYRSQPQRTLDLIKRIQDAGGLSD